MMSVTHPAQLIPAMTHPRHVMPIDQGSAPARPYLPLHLPHRYHHSLSLPIMKSFALLTASVLLGTASAEVHKLKLNKVPLEDQLVRSGDRSGTAHG